VKVSDNLGSSLPGSACAVVVVVPSVVASGADRLVELFVRLRREVEKRAVIFDDANGENVPSNELVLVQGRNRSGGK